MTVRFAARARAFSRLPAFVLLVPLLILPALDAGAIPGAVPWTPNDGQWRPEVAFHTQAAGVETWLLRDAALVYRIAAPSGSAVLRESLIGATPGNAVGANAAPTRASFFLGADRARWRPDLPTWQEVALEDVYPGIDLTLRLAGGTVEKVFAVQPGTSPDAIRFRMTGHDTLTLGADGTLEAGVAGGGVRHSAPVAWQEVDGEPRPVEIAWRMVDDDQYGFAVGDHDPRRALFIDPLIQATFVGGSGDDTGGTQVHSNGDLYVFGSTDSTDLPGTTGAFQPAAGGGTAGNNDVFIARVAPGLTTLVRVTYLGGTGNEFSSGVDEAANGDIVIAGSTTSADLPGVTNGAQDDFAGGVSTGDVFVARVNADLTTLVQSTYFGGTGDDQLVALRLDASDNVFVAGTTASTDLPGTAGAPQTTNAGPPFFPGEGFIARLTGTLTTLTRTTYVGGSLIDQVGDLEVRPTGVFIAGTTSSENFPGLTGGAQTILGGDQDVFIALFSTDLTTRTQSTLLGGTDFESSVQLTFVGGSLYATGTTSSDDFPDVAGGAQSVYGGGDGDFVADAFITLLNPALTSFVQSTYLGGSGYEFGFLSEEGGEFLYVSGSTSSPDFPGTTGGAQPNYAGAADDLFGGDAFAALLNPGLTTLIQATYLGGGGDDFGFVTRAAGGNVYVSGNTNSADFPAVAGGVQSTFGGEGDLGTGDAFVSLLSGNLQTLIQSTYYGGSGDEFGGLLPPATGSNVYLVGSSTSPTLLGTTGGAQPANAGGFDQFMALLGADLTGDGGGGGTPGPLVAAVLPGSRAVGVGVPASAFGLMINAGTGTATGCGISPVTVVPATFNYQTTNPTTNALVGTPNTPVSIAAGAAQTYVFDFTPNGAFASTVIQLAFDCTNTNPAGVTPGVNTFTLTSSTVPGPDVIAIALTPTNNGIALLPSPTGAVAFAVATSNVGASGTVTVSTNTGSASLGLNNFVCETNTAGACLATPSATVTTTMNAGTSTAFSVFLNASQAIPASPAINRVNVIFTAGATQVGSTSVATQTP